MHYDAATKTALFSVSGFASGAFGKLARFAPSGAIGKGAAATLAGGFASSLTGGKFEDGAFTAGLGFAQNYLASSGIGLFVLGMFTEKNTDHDYEMENAICHVSRCSKEVFESRFHTTPDPFSSDAMRPGVENRLVGGNYVISYISADRSSHLNETVDGKHIFDGAVLRASYVRNGVRYISTKGFGFGQTPFNAMLNNIMGHIIFGIEDRAIRRDIRKATVSNGH